MTESPLPEPIVSSPPRWLPSLIWLVPIVAALIGASLVVRAVMERGPEITVSFATAEGLEAGKTKVKYRAVDVGEVTTVRLSADRRRVVATIALDKTAEGFAVADSRFWVVRPRLAGSGVSGLNTLLSGSYIGVDGGKSGERRTEFTGLEEPPVVASDVPGRRFVLHARDAGSLDVGSPVYFRRIQVGHVESFVLDPDGRRITMGVFVKSPYDRFVTEDARFWHASGVDLRLDAEGVKLETQSLASILMGGVAFESAGDQVPAAAEGWDFELAADRAQAMARPDGEAVTVVLRFRDSVRGLAAGAPLDFRGVSLGRVTGIALAHDPRTDAYSTPVSAVVYPDRLGPEAAALSAKERERRFADLIRKGLRAQLKTGSLITGQLYVALDFFPGAAPARAERAGDAFVLPTVPGDLTEIQQQVRSILTKVEKIPFDTLGRDAHTVMTTLNGTLSRLDALAATGGSETLPELKQTLVELRGTLAAMQAALAPDSPVQQDARRILQTMSETARSLKALAETLDRRPESLIRGK